MVVQADRDPVRAQHRVRRGGLLLHRELGEPALGIQFVRRPQRVHPGGLQPFLRPRGQLPARGFLQRGQQVGQRRVAPRVRAEILPHAGQEILPPDVGHQLLEHRGALGVGDPVEIYLDRLNIGDIGRNRMGGRQLILPVRPGLVQLRERGPGRCPPGRLGLRERARPGSEGLVQPQVIPPPHGDQVAEPHVRHFVQDRLAPRLPGEIGDPRPENVGLQESDAARVFHRALFEFWHEKLVVFPEGIFYAERTVVEVEALPGGFQDFVRVEIGGQRLTAVDAERNAVVLVADHVIGPGRAGRDVGRHDRSRREVPAQCLTVLGRAVLGARLGRHVRDHHPVRRGGHRQLVAGLHVRLVEARVHPVRVERLQVRVQVDALVGRVGEPVQPFAAARVGAVGRHPQHIARRQAVQRDPVAVERVQADRRPVQGDLPHRGGGQVEKRGRARCRAVKPDHGDRAEHLAARPRQVQVHLVRDDLDEGRTSRRFVASQVRCHRVFPFLVSAGPAGIHGRAAGLTLPGASGSPCYSW